MKFNFRSQKKPYPIFTKAAEVKRLKIVVSLVVYLSSAGFSADKIGSVFSGVDYLPDNEYNETRAGVYKLQHLGIAAGFFLPLNIPYVDAHFKLKASMHQIEKRAWDWASVINKDESALFDKHVSGLNEILIGKEIASWNKFSILPQLGLGLQLDALTQNGDSPVGGIVYSDVFSDFSSRFRYRFTNFGLEFIVNYQLSLIPSWSGYEATDRISASFAIYK
jgi:hypothetical protein